MSTSLFVSFLYFRTLCWTELPPLPKQLKPPVTRIVPRQSLLVLDLVFSGKPDSLDLNEDYTSVTPKNHLFTSLTLFRSLSTTFMCHCYVNGICGSDRLFTLRLSLGVRSFLPVVRTSVKVLFPLTKNSFSSHTPVSNFCHLQTLCVCVYPYTCV